MYRLITFLVTAAMFTVAATSNAGDPTATANVMIFSEGERPPEHLRDENRAFQGIPGIDGSPNGRLWATWYGGGRGEDQNNVVMLATSGDDGASWSDLRVIVDTKNPIRAFDPVVWTDPLGRLWLIWAQAVSHGVNAHTWAMITENPDEDYPTWQAPFMIGPGVMMNKPTVTQSGDWLFPISDWEGRRLRTEGVATAGTVVTRDNGRTFETLGAAYVPVEHRQYDEHMFVEKNDGSLWMWVRTRYGIGTAESKDGGNSWSELLPSEVQHPVTRFYIRRLQSGNLLLVKHGPLDEQIGRSQLMAYVSRDDGKTWEGGVMLEDRDCSYPDGFQAEDGKIYIVYDRSRRGEKQIKMAVFTEADALAGRPVSDHFRTKVLVNQATGDGMAEMNIDFNANKDGEKPLGGAVAEWTVESEGTIQSFATGSRIFTDRNYNLAQFPEALKGSRFIQAPLGEAVAVCTKGGVVYVATPSSGRNRHSLHNELIGIGFVKVAIPEFLLFRHSTGAANACSVYQKKVTAGERLSLGRWGVIIIPPF
jgi:hypothetical protein